MPAVVSPVKPVPVSTSNLHKNQELRLLVFLFAIIRGCGGTDSYTSDIGHWLRMTGHKGSPAQGELSGEARLRGRSFQGTDNPFGAARHLPLHRGGFGDGGARGARPTGVIHGRGDGRTESSAPTKGTRGAAVIERRGEGTPPYQIFLESVCRGRRPRRPVFRRMSVGRDAHIAPK